MMTVNKYLFCFALAAGSAMAQEGTTPLMECAGSGSAADVRALIAAGADVNARNAYGQPPLHLAAFYGYEQIVDQLLAAGANLRTRNTNGLFAAQLAATPTLAARLEPPYHPEDDAPLPPEIEDADYEPEEHEGCSCGGHDCDCHGHDCDCGHHHH